MNNYSDMTDFEINKSVGEIVLEGKWACKPGDAGNESESWYYGSVDTFVNPYPPLPDYCNSWADAGPIIEKHGVGLKRQSNGVWVSTQQGGLWPKYHENPLRAAMIVFLMMQESK